MSTFSQDNAKRIAKATRQVERTEFHPKGWYHELTPQTLNQNGFYARITEIHCEEDTPTKYSWEKVEANLNGDWTARPEWEKGGPKYEGLEDYFAVHPNGQGTLEVGTIVLCRWSIDQKHVVITYDQIIRFELQEPMDALNSEAQAKAIDKEGNSYGCPFMVHVDPALSGIYGPADSGFRGFAIRFPVRNSGKGYETPESEYEIINMQRYAEHIWFPKTDFADCSGENPADYYWHGEDPKRSVKLIIPPHLPCECFKKDVDGSAILDERKSTNNQLVYNVTDVCQLLRMYQLDDCEEDCPPDDEGKTKYLGIADRLEIVDKDCDQGCTKILKWKGVKVEGCDSGGSGSLAHDLKFEDGFGVEVTGDCPKIATIQLKAVGSGCIEVTKDCESGLIIRDTRTFEGQGCCEVTEDGCHVLISVPCGSGYTSITGSGCISVEGSGGDYVISDTRTFVGSGIAQVIQNDCETIIYVPPSTPGNVTLSGSGCIDVSQSEEGEYIISDTRTFVGSGVAQVIESGCEVIIYVPPGSVAISGSGCIDVSQSEEGYTISDTRTFTAGEGIAITSSGCDTTIAIGSGPTTTIRYVCDVFCNSSGQIEVYYGEMEIYNWALASFTSECEE